MNILKSTQKIGAGIALLILAGIATPALAGHDDDDRGRGDRGHYQNYDRGGWNDRGGWGREHEHRRHYDRDVYYAAPYYVQPRVVYAPPPRVVYAPPPVVYYPSAPYRSGIDIRFQQLF